MTCHYRVLLSEIGLVYSTKETETKDAECIFSNGKFSEDGRRENWIKCFSCSLRVHINCPGQRTQNISVTFINGIEAEMVFT